MFDLNLSEFWGMITVNSVQSHQWVFSMDFSLFYILAFICSIRMKRSNDKRNIFVYFLLVIIRKWINCVDVVSVFYVVFSSNSLDIAALRSGFILLIYFAVLSWNPLTISYFFCSSIRWSLLAQYQIVSVLEVTNFHDKAVRIIHFQCLFSICRMSWISSNSIRRHPSFYWFKKFNNHWKVWRLPV